MSCCKSEVAENKPLNIRRIEIAILRSESVSDDYVWETYAPLIGALCIDCGAHFFIVGNDYSFDTEESDEKQLPEEIDYVMVATDRCAEAFEKIIDRMTNPVRIITDGCNGSIFESLSITLAARTKGVDYRVIQGDADEICKQIKADDAMK